MDKRHISQQIATMKEFEKLYNEFEKRKRKLLQDEGVRDMYAKEIIAGIEKRQIKAGFNKIWKSDF